MRHIALVSLICLAAFSGPGAAATFDVPVPYATIQAGIDAAAAGDTIRVAAGYYQGPGNYDLEITGDDKVLLSVEGAEFTTIDCAHQGVGVHVWEGPTAATVISGFTIIQASGGNGAGIVVHDAAATIEHCQMIDCHATSNGGGIYIGYTTETATVTDCLITGCSGEFRAGGILVDHGDAVISDCLVYDNLCRQMGGSGLYNNHSTVIATGCTFAHNETQTGEGCITQYGATTNLENCIIAFTAIGTATSGWIDCVHCLSFGNDGGDVLDGVGENIYLDPHFCDAGAPDYSLCANSPCDAASLSNPWGERVGALAAGCAACPPTPTELISWSELKSIYAR